MNLRLPFAENNERDTLAGTTWEMAENGKGTPESLWQAVDNAVVTNDFQKYVNTLGDSRRKVIIFDIPTSSWTVSTDIYDMNRLRSGSYVQLPHKPHVYNDGTGVTLPDVYNYLYCVSRVGIDCSGFVWQTLTYAASRCGLDLTKAVSRYVGAPPGAAVNYFIGTSYYDSKSRALENVPDKIANLRPGDIMLFRGSDGKAVHSAVIQSIDFDKGVIRYLQSTDEAPEEERGVHESFVQFDPQKSDTSLSSLSLTWSQKRYPPFPGEMQSAFSDDGERYRAYPELGGGRVVRFKMLSRLDAGGD
jgi:cell wall-associated NlpC family hydrolase